MNKLLTSIIIAILVAVAAYFGIVRKYNLGSNPGTEIYRNEQYGFQSPIPTGWHGYTVLNYQWEGQDVATGHITERGPLITLRSVGWSSAHPYEDMPVMVFTPSQWDKVRREQLSVGAAPIPPSELARNSRYVFALPARYNYDYADGWQEVDRLIHHLTAFEPTTGTSGWKTYTNTADAKFSIQYPKTWKFIQQVDAEKTYAVNFDGTEGNIYIVWGDGFGGGYCTDPDNLGLKMQLYSLAQQGLSGCVVTSPDGIKSWLLLKEIRNGLSIKIQAKGTASSGGNQVIEQALSTFRFTK